jgi:hypothetical protein
MFVGRNKVNLVAHRLTDKAIQGSSVGVLNYLANRVALAGGRTDNRSLAGKYASAFHTFADVSVVVPPADKGFVHFDDTPIP